MDLHWCGSPGSGSVLAMRIRIRIQEQENIPIFTNKPDFKHFKKAFLLNVGMYYVSCIITNKKYIFHVTLKNFQWRLSLTRIRMYPHWSGVLNPDSHWGKKLDQTVVKQMWIHNTDCKTSLFTTPCFINACQHDYCRVFILAVYVNVQHGKVANQVFF